MLKWGDRPVRLVGCSYYGLVADREFDADAFLETLAGHNVNFTRFFVMLPWPVSDEPNLLLFARQGDKYDLRNFDPAFCQTTGAIAQINAALVAKVVATLGDRRNVIYEIINEPYPQLGPLPQWHHFIAGELQKNLAGRRCKVIASTGAYDDPLIPLFSMHMAGSESHVNAAREQQVALEKDLILSDDGDLRCMFHPEVTRAAARRANRLNLHFEHLAYSVACQREVEHQPASAYHEMPGLLRENLAMLAEFSQPLFARPYVRQIKTMPTAQTFEVSAHVGHPDRVCPNRPDGSIRPARRGSVDCYEIAADRRGKYAYFRLDRSFPRGGAPQRLLMTVNYFDQGEGRLVVHYDSERGAYMAAAPVTLEASNRWRTSTIALPDATPRGRQNDGADLRLSVEGGSQPLALRRVNARRDDSDAVLETGCVD